MKKALFALCLGLTAATTNACNGAGTPLSPEERTLARIEPLITRDLTPALARQRIGTPDAEPGSGLVIFTYRVDAGRTVWLSFPGFSPIIRASVEEADGTRRELPIR